MQLDSQFSRLTLYFLAGSHTIGTLLLVAYWDSFLATMAGTEKTGAMDRSFEGSFFALAVLAPLAIHYGFVLHSMTDYGSCMKPLLAHRTRRHRLRVTRHLEKQVFRLAQSDHRVPRLRIKPKDNYSETYQQELKAAEARWVAQGYAMATILDRKQNATADRLVRAQFSYELAGAYALSTVTCMGLWFALRFTLPPPSDYWFDIFFWSAGLISLALLRSYYHRNKSFFWRYAYRSAYLVNAPSPVSNAPEARGNEETPFG